MDCIKLRYCDSGLELEVWLAFLSDDRPEKIIELITRYPEFKPILDAKDEEIIRLKKEIEELKKK